MKNTIFINEKGKRECFVPKYVNKYGAIGDYEIIIYSYNKNISILFDNIEEVSLLKRRNLLFNYFFLGLTQICIISYFFIDFSFKAICFFGFVFIISGLLSTILYIEEYIFRIVGSNKICFLELKVNKRDKDHAEILVQEINSIKKNQVCNT